MSRFPVALGLALALAGLPTSAALASPDQLVLVSRGFDGLPGGATAGIPASEGPVISADGQRVAFVSAAPNMGVDDNNDQKQVYLRDLGGGGPNLLVSRADGPDGAPADNGGAINALDPSAGDITPDGRLVDFNADLGDGHYYGYRRDVEQGTTTLVTRTDGPDGAPVEAGGPYANAGGGRYILFSTNSAVIPALGPLGGASYVRDLASGATALVTRATGAGGAPAPGWSSGATGMSPGGRYVAFVSTAGDLAAGPALPDDGTERLYVRDLRYGRTILAGRATGPGGPPVSARSSGPTPILGDGCRIAFDATGTDVAPGTPSNGSAEVYVRDLCAATTTLVSRADGPDGAAAATPAPTTPFSGGVHAQGMSADGRYVLFTATVGGLVPGAAVPDGVPENYVRDLVAGRTILVTRADGPDGAPDADSSGHYGEARMTPDARFVAFASSATNLVAGTGGVGQVYRRELGSVPAGTPVAGCGLVDDPNLGGPPAPPCPAGGDGGGGVLPPRGPVTVPVPAVPGGGPATGTPIVATEPTLVRAPTLRSVRATRARVTAWVDLPATVEVRLAREVVARAGRRSWRALTPARKAVLARAGTARVALPKLAHARYRLTIRALGPAGSRSAAVTRTLDLRPKPTKKKAAR
jgi:Tol biopolymer transport system component